MASLDRLANRQRILEQNCGLGNVNLDRNGKNVMNHESSNGHGVTTATAATTNGSSSSSSSTTPTSAAAATVRKFLLRVTMMILHIVTKL